MKNSYYAMVILPNSEMCFKNSTAITMLTSWFLLPQQSLKHYDSLKGIIYLS